MNFKILALVLVSLAASLAKASDSSPLQDFCVLNRMSKGDMRFVISNPNNHLISRVLKKSDVFMFPIGLIHFLNNRGNGSAVATMDLTIQSSGVITIANAMFGSNPRIDPDVLTKTFQVDKNVVDYLQFWVDNNNN